MSSSSPSSPSSSSTHRIPVITVTILSPSATSHVQPANHNGSTTIPVGSIVGGCLAGILLAVAAVVGWHLWGRSIKRKDEARRKEAVRPPFDSPFPTFHLTAFPHQISYHTTKKNTNLNAVASSPSSYTPSFREHTQDRKVKFAGQTPNTQIDKAAQLPALYHASLPVRPSPLSQSEVMVEHSTVK